MLERGYTCHDSIIVSIIYDDTATRRNIKWINHRWHRYCQVTLDSTKLVAIQTQPSIFSADHLPYDTREK